MSLKNVSCRAIPGQGCQTLASPTNGATRLLAISRITGSAPFGPIEFETADCETLLICVQGRAFFLAVDELYELAPFDGLYLPSNISVCIDADGGGCDLAAAPVNGSSHPVQFVPFEAVRQDRLEAGVTIIGETVAASRLLAGLSFDGAFPTGAAFDSAQVGFRNPDGAWRVVTERLVPPAVPPRPTPTIWLLAALEEGNRRLP